MKPPQPISDYLSDWLMQKCGFGYIMLDIGGRVNSWGGDLERLGIEPPRAGRPIAEQLLFMEGLLPLAEPALQLPMVQLDAQLALDVHLFKITGGYGLLLMDASMDALKQGICQQQANASALAGQKTADSQEPAVAALRTDNCEDLFHAANIAALELDPDEHFSLIARAPQWLNQICPQDATQPLRLDPDNFFSFLENFMHEAREFWNREQVGCIRSGLWVELDEEKNEHFYEATALYTGQRKILLISREHRANFEKQNLIQKGREIALSRHALARTQRDLQHARDHLELRVKERTRELEQMNARLAHELDHRRQLETERSQMVRHLQQAQKMEAIGTLAGGIAHDFNNILAAVMGFTELSLLDAPQGSHLENNLRQVLSAGLRAKKLISQILTFSRQSNPETQPVQVKVIINEVIELLRASLTATIEIEQDLQSDAYVMADPSQLHQVAMNLCTNATHAMQPDGGVLKLVLHECEIGPNGSPHYPDIAPGSYLEIAISDSGSGMSPETLKRIFDPFFTTKEKGQGTGMGLSVVHGIVKNCQGEIAVASKVGEGTTFRIILPTTTGRDISAIQSPIRLAGGHECILYVDDEPMQADLVQKFLKPLGYRVVAFTDSTLALQAFMEDTQHFDLVLTDVYMPKMTGKILSAEIKKIRPEIPIILCSGHSEEAVDPSSTDRSINGYLIKPFSMHELVAAIRGVLEVK